MPYRLSWWFTNHPTDQASTSQFDNEQAALGAFRELLRDGVKTATLWTSDKLHAHYDRRLARLPTYS